ncbi:MAG: M20/M25/M40 family metallo-hydrolase [Caldisericia bacterium]|nr:M20/M25/M40 family metallo-hydrolase [Caldisericia bacterium]
MSVQEKKALAILQQLVRIRTHQPEGDESDLLDYILTLFPFDRVKTHIIDHGENRSSLVAKFPGRNSSRTIALVGQMDTHGLTSTERWDFPPYRATFRNGFVYGRGTSNMKGGLASIILALQNVLAKQDELPVNILLCMTADGELNGMGAKAIVDGGFLKEATELIFVEPTDEKIAIAQKGALWIKVAARGKSCHTCFPENGIDALAYLNLLCREFRRRIVSNALPHPLLGLPLCIITRMEGGGEAPNFLAGYSEAILDIRLLPYQDNMEILKIMNDISKSLSARKPGLSFMVDVLVNRQSSTMPENAPLVKRFQENLEALGMETRLAGFHSFSDVSRIVPYLGLPFIIFGPGEDIVETTINERVSLSSVVNVAKALTRYIETS